MAGGHKHMMVMEKSYGMGLASCLDLVTACLHCWGNKFLGCRRTWQRAIASAQAHVHLTAPLQLELRLCWCARSLVP